MSKSVPVISGDALLWAYDVALGVLFIEAAHVGAETPAALQPPWWPELEHDLCTHALLGGSFALVLDDFGTEQRRLLLDCVTEAARRFETRGGVSREEVASWPELEESATAFLRGARHVDAAPLVELAEALAELAAGAVPPGLTGRQSFYGCPAGRRRTDRGGPPEWT